MSGSGFCEVTELFYKTDFDASQKEQDDKLTELMDNISSIFFTTSYYGNRIIKELYLTGCSDGSKYKIYLKKGDDFHIII